MDNEEPILPPLLRPATKRPRLNSPQPAHLFTDSSEPAVFSSDDDPNIDNYVAGRRKKRFVGPWFQTRAHDIPGTDALGGQEEVPAPSSPPLPATKPKRTLKRELDSGVWIPSDDSVAEEDGEEAAAVAPAPRQSNGFQRTASIRNIGRAEARAQQIIQECVDEGIEMVDLSHLGLETIAASTIHSLQGIQIIPMVVPDVPFLRREVELKLILAQNRLPRIPSAIFDLNCLVVLSLRNNSLKELPVGIGKLRNLEQLNLSQNQFRWLPAELLDLILESKKLRDLQLLPNPFCMPNAVRETSGSYAAYWHAYLPARGEAPVETPPPAWTRTLLVGARDFASHHKTNPNLRGSRGASCRSRSPVQYFDGLGVNLSDFDLSDEQLEIPRLESPFQEPEGPPDALARRLAPASQSCRPSQPETQRTGARSLLELALQSCMRTPETVDLPSLMPEHAPRHLLRLIDRAVEARESGGGHRCARPECGRRDIIVPRTQWIEWWDLGSFHLRSDEPDPQSELPEGRPMLRFSRLISDPVPFLSRGCSWRCLPSAFPPVVPSPDDPISGKPWW